jgi:hypothetical protein
VFVEKLVLLSLSIYGPTVLSLDLGRFFSFLILYTVGRAPWMGDQPVAWPLPTHRKHKHRIKRTQTSMPRVGFEPTIPMFERAKTVHVLLRGHCDRHNIAKSVRGKRKLKWQTVI